MWCELQGPLRAGIAPGILDFRQSHLGYSVPVLAADNVTRWIYGTSAMSVADGDRVMVTCTGGMYGDGSSNHLSVGLYACSRLSGGGGQTAINHVFIYAPSADYTQRHHFTVNGIFEINTASAGSREFGYCARSCGASCTPNGDPVRFDYMQCTALKFR